MAYYDYYGGYGAEEPVADEAPLADEYAEEPAVTAETDNDSEFPPMVMAYMLVPVLDGVSWYVTNDKWSASSVSQWDNAAMSILAKTIFGVGVTAAAMAVGGPTEMLFYYGAPISAVWELVNLYLVNNAEGTSASSTNSTTIAYGLAATSAALSVVGFMGMMDSAWGDEEAEADEYYEEPAEAVDEPADDGADSGSGYDAYSYYG